jgi:hypothetical protein
MSKLKGVWRRIEPEKSGLHDITILLRGIQLTLGQRY